MNQERFFIPNMATRPIMRMSPNLGINPLMRTSTITPRIGLFSKITNGIKGINWSGLLSGANKTLNVVNQTIPLIRQTKPMINNVKNMVHLAKAFRKETKIINKSTNNLSKNISKNNFHSNDIQKKEILDNNNYPNFFI